MPAFPSGSNMLYCVMLTFIVPDDMANATEQKRKGKWKNRKTEKSRRILKTILNGLNKVIVHLHLLKSVSVGSRYSGP